MRYIIREVTCLGCGQLIDKPSDADMELFRLGVHVHNLAACLVLAEKKLEGGSRN